MKNHRSARRMLKVRVLVLCLAVVGIAAIGLHLGDTLPQPSGKVTTPAPKVDIGVLLATNP